MTFLPLIILFERFDFNCKTRLLRHCVGSGFIEFGIGSSLLLNPDSDPYPDQGFVWQNEVFTKYNWKTFLINVFLTPYKGRSGSSNMKFLHFFLFWGTIFAYLDPDPNSHSGSADPVDSNWNTGLRLAVYSHKCLLLEDIKVLFNHLLLSGLKTLMTCPYNIKVFELILLILLRIPAGLQERPS
jgi:hypothetical protein